jgi:hypothetical protein
MNDDFPIVFVSSERRAKGNAPYPQALRESIFYSSYIRDTTLVWCPANNFGITPKQVDGRADYP